MRTPFVRRGTYELLRKEKKQIDWLMWLAGLVGPISTIPQIYVIYANQSATDISLLSWLMYTATTMIFLLYSIIHKLRPLIINSVLWMIANVAVRVGIIIYE